MNVVEHHETGTHSATPAADLVQQYAGLVKQIARQLAASLPPSVELGDLIQAGMIGLLESAGQFDDSRGATFETYISIRVRGAMLDDLRKLDWAPRSVRRNARSLAAAARKVECRTGRDAGSTEVAAELGIDLAQYQQMAADTARAQVVSLSGEQDDENFSPEVVAAADPADGPQETAELEDMERALNEAVTRLPPREFRIVSLHYAQDLPLSEIGVRLGITETRVRQILSLALLDLHKQITARKGCQARRQPTVKGRWHERRRTPRLMAALVAWPGQSARAPGMPASHRSHRRHA